MTPEPPSSSGGSSLPPRQRPNLSSLANDTTERDLWALEDELDAPEVPGPPADEEARPQGASIPAPRETYTRVALPAGETPAAKPEAADHIRVNVSKPRAERRPLEPTAGYSRAEHEFDDLEAWEDVSMAPEIGELPEAAPLQATAPEAPAEPVVGEVAARDEAASAEPEDEFSPVVKQNAAPVSLRPKLGLSKIERIGLAALLVVMLFGGVAVFVFSLNRLPQEPEKARANDFPLKGAHLTVRSAKTYWRAPVTGGPSADTFRLGTQLLPVLELDVSGGGPAAIRVHFKNDENAIVGDTVSRTIDAGGTLKIAATAGFDDIGMHAAYRTGESKPWTVEVFEAPSANAPSHEFKKLFEMEISTDRR